MYVSAGVDYELSKYDEYMNQVHVLLQFGLSAEARVYKTLSDLCYEKVTMLVRLEKFTGFMKRRLKPISTTLLTKAVAFSSLPLDRSFVFSLPLGTDARPFL